MLHFVHTDQYIQSPLASALALQYTVQDYARDPPLESDHETHLYRYDAFHTSLLEQAFPTEHPLQVKAENSCPFHQDKSTGA